jgi:integrase
LNDKHRAQWKSTLEHYAFPVLGSIPVGEVDTPLVLKVLRPVWDRTPETASRLRGRIERVLAFATVQGLRAGDNPARWRGHLQEMFAAKPKSNHHKAVPFDEVPAFMAELRGNGSLSALALEFTILTAPRTSEVIGATWDEIDLSAKTWTVPAERMKAKQEHVVPLSDRAVEILKALPQRTGVLFGLSNMAMLELLKGKLGNGYTVHGFRSSFRDWAVGEPGASGMCLA